MELFNSGGVSRHAAEESQVKVDLDQWHPSHLCPECRRERMNTPSGSVCPLGHGRIMPPVTSQQLRLYRLKRYYDSLPRAKRIAGNTYEIEGQRYVRASNDTMLLKAAHEGKIIRLKLPIKRGSNVH